MRQPKHWYTLIAEASEAERLEKMQTKQKWRDAWKRVKQLQIEAATKQRERQT